MKRTALVFPPEAWLPALALLLLHCGGGGGGTDGLVCSPPCPSGTHCASGGCVPDLVNPRPDAGAPQDLATTCSPACGGATPYCNASNLCVACQQDSQCPAGKRCRPSGSVTVCVDGCNNDGQCGGGTCCAGSCSDTGSDASNCGGCGLACSPSHATPTCHNGTCTPGACNPGWADCNKNPADGCETNLHNDPANCGACGTACKIANAVAGCSGTCYIAACRFGFDNCDGMDGNGCETSVLTDPKNCGACGAACSAVPHARNACVNAACQLASCDVGFADCNGNPKDGCEVNIFLDAGNCGSCGAACGKDLVCKNGGCTCPQCNFPNASSKCINNVCVLDICTPGFFDCNNDPKDGCEVNIFGDRLNCGACGAACGKMEACSKGKCVVGGVDAFGEFRPSLHCADFKNNGNNYQQYCFGLKGVTMCLGQNQGGKIACNDLQGGLQFVFDFNSTWPMRFTKNTPDCQNYNPDFLQNLTLALGYNSFTINSSKAGNFCPLTWIDDNGDFAISQGNGMKVLPFDVTFTF